MRKHTDHAQDSVNQCSGTVVELLRRGEGELQIIFYYKSILGDCLLDFSRVPPFRDLLLFSCMDAASDSKFFAMPAFDEFQTAGSTCFRKDSKTPLMRST